MPSLKSLILLATLLTLILAVTENWNTTGAGCVDPDGYLSCSQNCNFTATTDTQKYQQCVLRCDVNHMASKVRSCWNQVCPLEPRSNGSEEAIFGKVSGD
jgi:hypothetical protein